jgi:hypothetical protein
MRKSDVTKKIKPVAKVSHFGSWAIYGRAGTGKTTFASSFPKPILLLDVKDEGTGSVVDVEQLDVINIESCEELEDVFWFLEKNPKKYKTVIIDTVSQWQQLKVEEISQGKNLKGRAPGDWGSMAKQDWGTVASYLKTWITNFRDLPMETVFLAQDRTFNFDDEVESNQDLTPEVGPRLSPSVSSHLCAAVSVIGNTFIRSRTVKKKIGSKSKEVQRIEYCLRLGPNSVYITKMRKPKSVELPNEVINPTFDDLINLSEGED